MNNLEYIDQYLNGELSDSDIQLFEKRLATDIKFKEQFLLIKGIAKAKSYKVNEFEDLLVDLRKSHGEPKLEEHSATRINLLKRRRLYAIAAGLSLLIVSAFILQQFLQRPDNNQLYSNYFELYPNNISVRDDQTKRLDNAISLYEQQEFQDAINEFELLLSEASSDTVHFFMGISQMAIDDQLTARRHLTIVADQNSSTYQNQALYYLALSFIKNNKLSEAQTLLARLQQSDDSFYQEKANNILQEIQQ